MLKHNTKQILANSLEDLLKTRSFENITVQQIVDNCDASRTAFYNHFEDKYDLMIWIHRNYVDELIKNHMEISKWRNLSLEICKFLYAKREYFTKIIEYKGQNSIPDFFIDYGNDYLINLLKKELGLERIPQELLYSVKIYNAGTSVVTLEWIKSGMNEQPEEISRILCDNVPVPLAKYLK